MEQWEARKTGTPALSHIQKAARRPLHRTEPETLRNKPLHLQADKAPKPGQERTGNPPNGWAGEDIKKQNPH